ncbi:MAG: polysaccharide biosynthesis protein [Geminicoccaceae bacterium]
MANYVAASNSLGWYQAKRQQIVYLHDLILAGLSLPVALYLRLGNVVLPSFWPGLVVAAVGFAAVAAVTFSAFGMHRRVWRYAAMSDLIVVLKCATIAILVFLPLMFWANRLADIPRSVPVIQWLVLIAMLCGPRFTYRILLDGRWEFRTVRAEQPQQVPVLLLGASEEASLFIRTMSGGRDTPYRVIGVLDQQEGLNNRSIHGVPLLDISSRLERIIDRLPIQDRPSKLVIADPCNAQLDGPALRSVLDQAEKLGLTVARLPSLVEFKDAVSDGAINLRPIDFEDLLSRPQAVLDRQAIDHLISGRRVLVTGAGGTIGGELARQVAALGPAELTLLDNCEFNLYKIDVDLHEKHADLPCRAVLCDIRDRGHIEDVFTRYKPELVFHAAALKHVPMVELNPFEGVRTNVLGTRNVADAAYRHHALAVVQISTDKAVNPTSIMGASKRLAEFYCQSLDNVQHGAAGSNNPPTPRFMIVRFGNVLGSSGSVVPRFQQQLANGGPLTVTHPDITRYFMTVREAVELVIQASAYGLAHPEERGRIFVLDMGEPLKIVDVARRLIRLAGLRPDVDVGIDYVGLRPGEKLYEELFDDGEERLPAAIDGVELAASRPIDAKELEGMFDELAAICEARDGEAFQQVLKKILPSYRTPEHTKEPDPGVLRTPTSDGLAIHAAE